MARPAPHLEHPLFTHGGYRPGHDSVLGHIAVQRPDQHAWPEGRACGCGACPGRRRGRANRAGGKPRRARVRHRHALCACGNGRISAGAPIRHRIVIAQRCCYACSPRRESWGEANRCNGLTAVGCRRRFRFAQERGASRRTPLSLDRPERDPGRKVRSRPDDPGPKSQGLFEITPQAE
jgi:hypothetical protein